MHKASRLFMMTAVIFLAAFGLHAQSGAAPANAQEDFALAAARAHAQTSLFTADGKPFAIHADVESALAIHGVGKGIYENRWVDNQHWQRILQFPDFKQQAMRNDSGHPWTDHPGSEIPIRIAQLLRFVVIHVPSSTSASRYYVSESKTVQADGKAVTCFSAVRPAPRDGFERRYQWCFDTASGLLVSQAMPLNLHITYENYIPFQGKQEFTHVHVTVNGLPVLSMDIHYEPLDPNALDTLVPDHSMRRSSSADPLPNPEEVHHGSLQYDFHPSLPPGTPEAAKKESVHLCFYVNEAGDMSDASVEDAPTLLMAQAALEAAPKFRFTPASIDGVLKPSAFCNAVWFSGASPDEANSPSAVASPSKPLNVYRSEDLSFAFRYPSDFELIPRDELEAQLGKNTSPRMPSLDQHSKCNTLLFKAQRARPGALRPQVISISTLSPDCIFGIVDQDALNRMASDTVGNFVKEWMDGTVSRPRHYEVGGRSFSIVSGSGVPRENTTEPLNILVVLTRIHEHVVCWMIKGPNKDLEQVLANSTLQFGTQDEIPLIPQSNPH